MVIRRVLAFLLVFLCWAQMATPAELGALHVLDIQSKPNHAVEMILSVLDKTGRPIKNLTPENFSLSVEGLPIKDFSLEPISSAKSPLSVVLAIDVSGSMKGEPMAEARKAAAIFLDELEKDDHVALITFGQGVYHLSDFAAKKHEVREQLQHLEAKEQWTWLYQATLEAMEKAVQAPTTRAAVILLTDGKDEGSPVSEEAVLDRIKGAQVPIYAMGFGSKAQVDYLQKVASASQGAFLSTPQAADLTNLYQTVLDYLKNQYILRFTYENPVGVYTSQLKLSVAGQELSTQRRFLYVAAEPQPQPPPAPIIIPQVPPLPALEPSPRATAPTPLPEPVQLPQPPPEWWQEPLWQGLVAGVALLGLGLLIWFLVRRWKVTSKLPEPVRVLLKGKAHSVMATSPGSGSSTSTRVLFSPGEVGLRLNIPPVPIFFALLDSSKNLHYQEIILTRYDDENPALYDNARIYLLFSDNTVSRPNPQRAGHARIFLDAETQMYHLEDLGSFSGTKLNDKPISEAAPLEDQDAITLGGVSLAFYDRRPLTGTRY
ncbi:VWA domain-containing protein [Desulfobacca acetoxidans]